MPKFASIIAALLLFVEIAPLCAQAPEDFPQPQKEHEWLKQLVGEWETVGEMKMEGQPAMTCKGTDSTRMLGGFWVVTEGKANPMGMQVESLMTLGYDPKIKKYVGTWADSMNDHMWKYEGTLDATGKTLTLDTEGPNFMADGKLTKFRDVITIADKDHRSLSSQIKKDDGNWVTFMTGTYTRKK